VNETQVVNVEPIGPNRLAVRFADGVAGEVEFRDSFFFGVFAALRDPAAFAQVCCEHGHVEWPGDLDLAPDAMYAEIRKSGRWVLE
jgi:hypothetical protein